MSQPTVSVVIPVYNVAQYLPQCLDSLIGQDLKNIEIICVNDGSKDDSLSILQRYAQKDTRIKIIDKANSGAGDSRNMGFTATKGKYVIFLDADDFFDKRMLSLAFARIKETDADMVVFRYYLYDNRTGKAKEEDYAWMQVRDIKKETFAKKDVPERIFNICANAPFVKLYKREFIAKHQLKFDNLKSCNDVAFSLSSLYHASKIALLDKPLVYYRINTNSQISATRGKHADNAFLALRSFLSQSMPEEKYLESFYRFAVGVLAYEYKLADEKKIFLQRAEKFFPADFYKIFLYKTGKIPFYKKIVRIIQDGRHKHIYLLGVHLKIKCKGK